MYVILADSPNGYITRVNEGKLLQIPIDVGSFAEKVLPILVQVYHPKQSVGSVYQNVRLSQTAGPYNASWLDHCLNKQTRVIIPTASSSTETSRTK